MEGCGFLFGFQVHLHLFVLLSGFKDILSIWMFPCMHVYVPNACLMAVDSRRVCGFLVIGVTDGGGLLCGHREPNSVPQKNS